MVVTVCQAKLADGRACRAAPLRDGAFCLMHDPDHAEEAAEARRLGGLRRRRDKTLLGVYDLASTATIEGLRRILDIAIFDTLRLDNSIARSRVLISTVMAGARLLETGELSARTDALEAAIAGRREPESS